MLLLLRRHLLLLLHARRRPLLLLLLLLLRGHLLLVLGWLLRLLLVVRRRNTNAPLWRHLNSLWWLLLALLLLLLLLGRGRIRERRHLRLLVVVMVRMHHVRVRDAVSRMVRVLLVRWRMMRMRVHVLRNGRTGGRDRDASTHRCRLLIFLVLLLLFLVYGDMVVLVRWMRVVHLRRLMTVRGLRRILAFFSATAASIPNEIDRVKLLNSLPRHAFGLSLALLLKELAPCALVLDPLAQLLVSARIKLSPRFATEQDQLFVVLVPLIVLLIHVGLSRPDVPLEILRFFYARGRKRRRKQTQGKRTKGNIYGSCSCCLFVACFPGTKARGKFGSGQLPPVIFIHEFSQPMRGLRTIAFRAWTCRSDSPFFPPVASYLSLFVRCLRTQLCS